MLETYSSMNFGLHSNRLFFSSTQAMHEMKSSNSPSSFSSLTLENYREEF